MTKEGVNPRLLQYALAIAGAIMVGVSQLPHLTWQGVVGVVGGVFVGLPATLKALGQFHITDVPEPIAEAVRDTLRPPPPDAA